LTSLILASASPRRRDMLERLGYTLEVRPTNVDEGVLPGELPAAYVARIAQAKAEAGAAGAGAGAWVLAADTTVTIDDAILAKAEDGTEAAVMLRRLSGRTHQVLTAFAIAGPRSASRLVSTDVDFIQLDDAMVADYVACGEWRDKAGAYAIQGIAASFVRAVRGSVTNVIGLPLAEVVAALRELGGPVPRLSASKPL
jgi:nucleoside triphosphate pyrophosphatase